MSRFILSPAATRDLDDLIEYLDALPEIPGTRLGKTIQDSIYMLAKHPGAGHIHSEYSALAGEEIGSFVQESYVFLYTATRNPILFVGIIHGKRDIDSVMRQRLE